ncbi:molybdopterin-dependent oxidoreductase [Ornithinicoccus halotolerans]|uniref:molybdopterin-dependent oxidoreductase n=1 Tax=Ornithinicoccus halotolerans TaxID=1748220 RepID=UPI0012957BBA|nr:molybdopterin-dependent oxidoreductase [Ornithinicoccus halotolerans]
MSRATRPAAGFRRALGHGWLNDPLGLLLLPFLGWLAVTGLVLFVQLQLGGGLWMPLLAAHTYAGLVVLPLAAAKGLAGARSGLRRLRQPGRRGLGPGQALTGAALVLGLALLLGSGLLMVANVPDAGWLKTVHAWSALLTAVPVAAHLVRYLRRSHRVTRQVMARAEPGTAAAGVGPAATSASRRGVLALGAVALGGWALLRGGRTVLESRQAAGPNDFPVTLTAAGPDQPDPGSWRMRVTGDVATPLEVGLEELRAGPVERHRYSLDCVLGWSATRTWGGVPMQELLDRAGAGQELLSVVVRSTTGYEVALQPATVRDRRTLVAWEVDGVDLTAEHGFPARVMAPDVIGEYCVKWIDSLTVVTA